VLALGLTAETLKAQFESEGHTVTIDDDDELPLDGRIAKALASPADVIVAAGGDGTVTALAEALVGTDKSLAILPLGTINLLARDLHLPLQLDQAVSAIHKLEPRRIDVGEVNGRAFLHKVVVGLIPAVAAGREKIRHRTDLAAKIGFLRYFLRRLGRAKRMAIVVEPSEGEPRVERVQAIAVASNGYDEGFGRFFSRRRLDRGTLTLYLLRHLNLGDVVRLTTGMFMGRWREDEALKIQKVKSVTIRSKKEKFKVMLDGEVQTLEGPLTFAIRPLSLSVLAPVEEAEGAREADEADIRAGFVAGA
jgi:diacylglycerol kinase family enzyme